MEIEVKDLHQLLGKGETKSSWQHLLSLTLMMMVGCLTTHPSVSITFDGMDPPLEPQPGVLDINDLGVIQPTALVNTEIDPVILFHCSNSVEFY